MSNAAQTCAHTVYANTIDWTPTMNGYLFVLDTKYNVSDTDVSRLIAQEYPGTAQPCTAPVCPRFTTYLQAHLASIRSNRTEDALRRNLEIQAGFNSHRAEQAPTWWTMILNQIVFTAQRLGIQVNAIAGHQPSRLAALLSKSSIPAIGTSAAAQASTTAATIQTIGGIGIGNPPQSAAPTLAQAASMPVSRFPPQTATGPVAPPGLTAAMLAAQNSRVSLAPADAAVSTPDYHKIPKVCWPKGAAAYYEELAADLNEPMNLRPDMPISEMIRRFGPLPEEIASNAAGAAAQRSLMQPADDADRAAAPGKAGARGANARPLPVARPAPTTTRETRARGQGKQRPSIAPFKTFAGVGESNTSLLPIVDTAKPPASPLTLAMAPIPALDLPEARVPQGLSTTLPEAVVGQPISLWINPGCSACYVGADCLQVSEFIEVAARAKQHGVFLIKFANGAFAEMPFEAKMERLVPGRTGLLQPTPLPDNGDEEEGESVDADDVQMFVHHRASGTKVLLQDGTALETAASFPTAAIPNPKGPAIQRFGPLMTADESEHPDVIEENYQFRGNDLWQAAIVPPEIDWTAWNAKKTALAQGSREDEVKGGASNEG